MCTAGDAIRPRFPAGRLSIDDGLTENALETVYTSTVVESGVANPNGCRPPVTWCVHAVHAVAAAQRDDKGGRTATRGACWSCADAQRVQHAWRTARKGSRLTWAK